MMFKTFPMGFYHTTISKIIFVEARPGLMTACAEARVIRPLGDVTVSQSEARTGARRPIRRRARVIAPEEARPGIQVTNVLKEA